MKLGNTDRLQTLLLDTLTLLCKNGLQFSKGLKIQGTLGVTVDEDDIVLVHFDKMVERHGEEEEDVPSQSDTSFGKETVGSKSRRRTKKRKRSGLSRVIIASQDLPKMAKHSNDMDEDDVELKFESLEEVEGVETNDKNVNDSAFNTSLELSQIKVEGDSDAWNVEVANDHGMEGPARRRQRTSGENDALRAVMLVKNKQADPTALTPDNPVSFAKFLCYIRTILQNSP